MLTSEGLTVRTLGPCSYDSPLSLSETIGDGLPDYTPEDTRVQYNVSVIPGEKVDSSLSFEKAGPRARLFFDPKKVYAAIVTCGGLCPGLNGLNVICAAGRGSPLPLSFTRRSLIASCSNHCIYLIREIRFNISARPCLNL